MAKKIDITEKLSFEENPRLVVKGKELEVNADAATVLEIMEILGEGEGTPKQVAEMYDQIFSDDAKKEIKAMKLSFKDFQTLVEAAITLITDDGEAGEIQTHAMT